MEPPSSELVDRLASLGLATAGDLERCRSLVRRMARGLPTIDSLWIDALVRLGRLSLYQARMLAQRRDEELRVDAQLVLRAPLHLDSVLTLFEAEDLSAGRKLLVSRISGIDGHLEAACQRLAKVIQGFHPCRDRLPDLPLAVIAGRNHVDVISPLRRGEPLDKLLVRRGRFPETVVRSVARSLARQLSSGQSLVPHGDLRPRNVWLTAMGECLLLNWGVLSVAVPEISIHSRLPLDAYDGLAPERIELKRPASTASDMYALGCLLWQLLAGRPPFLLAEPLGKLTAHCSRVIPDVRTIAPETSSSLAELVRSLTVREPHRRPDGFHEIEEELAGCAQRSGQRRVMQFVHSFESAVPRRSPPESKRPRRWGVAAVAAATCMLAVIAWNRGPLGLPALSSLSASISRKSSGLPTNPSADSSVSEKETAERRLPNGNDSGIVILEGHVRYLAGRLSGARELHLKADPQAPATILVRDVPLSLDANTVTLENVRIVAASSSSTLANEAGVQVQAQELRIRRCWFGNETNAATSPPSIRWRVRDVVDPRAGRLLVADTVFLQPATAIVSDSPLSTALFDNVLKRGSGALIQLSAGVRAGLKVPLVINHSTLRESGPLATLHLAAAASSSGRLSIQGADTVLDVADGQALLEFEGASTPARCETLVEVAATGLIVSPNLMLAGHRESNSGPVKPVDSSRMNVDGLLSGEFHFVDDPRLPQQRFEVRIDSLPVQGSAELPGVRGDRHLPPAEGL